MKINPPGLLGSKLKVMKFLRNIFKYQHNKFVKEHRDPRSKNIFVKSVAYWLIKNWIVWVKQSYFWKCILANRFACFYHLCNQWAFKFNSQPVNAPFNKSNFQEEWNGRNQILYYIKVKSKLLRIQG